MTGQRSNQLNYFRALIAFPCLKERCFRGNRPKPPKISERTGPTRDAIRKTLLYGLTGQRVYHARIELSAVTQPWLVSPCPPSAAACRGLWGESSKLLPRFWKTGNEELMTSVSPLISRRTGRHEFGS